MIDIVVTSEQIQSDPAYTDRFDLDTPVLAKKTQQWVLGLPKWLWELAAKQLDTTEVSYKTADFTYA